MALTGQQVVQKHQQAVNMCQGKSGWAALGCIVDAMHNVYKGGGYAGTAGGGGY